MKACCEVRLHFFEKTSPAMARLSTNTNSKQRFIKTRGALRSAPRFVLRFGNGYAHLILEIASMAATLYTLIDYTEGEDMSIASVGIARQ